MDLLQKIRTLPTGPGCYLYKNAEGEVIYVGKAKNLRARVRSYFLAASQANAKTGSLMREAVDLEYITVANEHEALALENNLIKQRKPRFNILLRDDKTYPYIKLTLTDRHPKVFVTRRLRKDGSAYFGPYFPGNLAHRLVDVIHRSFLIPSCKVDLNRYHPRPCLQYYIKRCLGPCVEGLISVDDYRQVIRDVQLFLDGKSDELEKRLTVRMDSAAENMQFELAARLRDQLVTVHQANERQRIASADSSDDADVFGFHFENDMLAVNLFHMRGGKIVDRRDMFWEDLPEFEEAAASLAEEDAEATDLVSEPHLEPNPAFPAPEVLADSEESEQHSTLASPFEADLPKSEVVSANCAVPELRTDNSQLKTESPNPTTFSPSAFFSALLKQLYLDQAYVPRHIYVPVDFPDRQLLADALRERCGYKIEIAVPQRGDKRSLVDLVCQNAKQSFDQRFRVLQPSIKAMQEALQDALTLPEPPSRIECFDISHIQGAETVASMVVWEKGAMKKSDYRKFQVKTVASVDDFASMREVVLRRYSKFANGATPTGKDSTLPSLILIDGGLGQLHAAASALEELGLTTQPLASIAKREEVIYVHGQEDEPVVLDRRSPVLHVIQKIRDESHRFAITYHRKRREMRDRTSELDAIPGVGPTTRQRLLTHFGSV
ncbi:MAG TPA: excinuclease ABC subunit UvrC, partial [Acidobacteriaceae bacterium]|nr:excinuclease ABC subunit UvrC [Acidobacteriaceae bacterium]